MELQRDGVADLDLLGVAEDCTGGVGGDGVTAFEDFERASLLELQGEACETLALGPQQAFGANAEIGSLSFEPQAKRGNLRAKIKRDDAHVRDREPFARLLKARAEAKGEASGHFIGALALLA